MPEPLWTQEMRASTVGTAADVNGDGEDEAIAGTEYYSWHLISRAGTALPVRDKVRVVKRWRPRFQAVRRGRARRCRRQRPLRCPGGPGGY